MTSSDPTVKTQKIAEAALNLKAEDLVALDMREITPFADVFVVATGNSDRHVRSIADAVSKAASEMGEPALGIEGYDDGRWVLLDLGDVIVHIFQPEVRQQYDLERLWSEAVPMVLEGVEPERVIR
jgi:ribosome-associated protein